MSRAEMIDALWNLSILIRLLRKPLVLLLYSSRMGFFSPIFVEFKVRHVLWKCSILRSLVCRFHLVVHLAKFLKIVGMGLWCGALRWIHFHCFLSFRIVHKFFGICEEHVSGYTRVTSNNCFWICVRKRSWICCKVSAHDPHRSILSFRIVHKFFGICE